MQPGFFILIVIAFLAVAGIGAYLAHLQEKKRREELAAFALRIGWRFDPTRDHSFDDRYHKFDAFRRGHSRYAHNHLIGSMRAAVAEAEPVELPVQAGDYHYKITSGSGKNRSTKTYRFSYLLVQVPMAGYHDLLIRTENLGDKMKGAFGFDDIDFESVEFSDRFWVTSSDKRFAYDVVHPRMMEYLMNSPAPAIQIGQGWLCVYGSGSRWAPHEFEMRLEWLERFFALWPRHVMADSTPVER